MPINWIAFAVTIWIGGMLWGALIDKWAIHSTTITTTLNTAALPTSIWDVSGWTGYLGAIFNVVTLNFSFFQGDLQFVRWLLLAPIIIALFWGLLTSVVLPLVGSLLRK